MYCVIWEMMVDDLLNEGWVLWFYVFHCYYYQYYEHGIAIGVVVWNPGC